MGALGNLGGAGGRGAAVAAAAGSGGVAASGAAAQLTGDRAQGESTADTATSGRFAGAVQALTAGTATAGRLAAGVAASAADVLSGAGVGYSAPYYGQPASNGAPPGGRGSGSGAPRTPRLGRPTRQEDGARPSGPMGPNPRGSAVEGDDGPVAVAWPAQQIDGTPPGEPGGVDPPAPRRPRAEDPGDGGAR